MLLLLKDKKKKKKKEKRCLRRHKKRSRTTFLSCFSLFAFETRERMGKKRPLFRSRKQLPLTSINNVKEPVQSLSAPISQVLRSKGGRPIRTRQNSEGSNVGVVASDDGGGGAAANSGGVDVRAIRKSRSSLGAKKRPTRGQSERVSRSAESTLNDDPEESLVGGKENLASSRGWRHAKGALFYQMTSGGRSLGSLGATPKEPYIGAKKFDGPKDGYVYTAGKFGLGYYVDQLPGLHAKMCAHAMFDVILDECMESVKRLSIIKARRVVNSLVDSTVEVSHYRSEIHWYENEEEQRNALLEENLDFASRHDQSRWESWVVVVREILRLQKSKQKENIDYLNSPLLKSAFAQAHSKRVEDVSAVQELLAEYSKMKGNLSMEQSTQLLSKYKISPRTLKGLHFAMQVALASKAEGKAAKVAPSICHACTSLKGRRLCSQCRRKKQGHAGDQVPSGRVRHDSYGSLLYKDLSWWESKKLTASNGAPTRYTSGREELHGPLLDMVYRLQSRAAKRILIAWKLQILQGKATRAKDRLQAAHIVAGAFRRWKKLLLFRGKGKGKQRGEEEEASSSYSSSSSSPQEGAPSSSAQSSYYVQKSLHVQSNMRKVGDMIQRG